jgi:hypothetical protein
MSLRASATIIGVRDLFAFSVRCLNHCTRALSGWNFIQLQASWIHDFAHPSGKGPFFRQARPAIRRADMLLSGSSTPRHEPNFGQFQHKLA